MAAAKAVPQPLLTWKGSICAQIRIQTLLGRGATWRARTKTQHHYRDHLLETTSPLVLRCHEMTLKESCRATTLKEMKELAVSTAATVDFAQCHRNRYILGSMLSPGAAQTPLVPSDELKRASG
jgi:hypothetical protein